MASTDVEFAIKDVPKSRARKRRRITKETRDEEDGVLPRQLARELGLPAFCDGTLSELTSFSRERGRKGLAVELELIGMRGVLSDEVSQRLSILRRCTWKDAVIWKLALNTFFFKEQVNRPHVERKEELETSAGLLSSRISMS